MTRKVQSVGFRVLHAMLRHGDFMAKIAPSGNKLEMVLYCCIFQSTCCVPIFSCFVLLLFYKHVYIIFLMFWFMKQDMFVQISFASV